MEGTPPNDLSPDGEIERKFLVPQVPKNLDRYPHDDLLQGYIAIAADGTEVRLRKIGDRYFETVKTGDGETRGEVEIALNQQQFDRLWALTEGRRIEKTRYRIDYERVVIELDVYRGRLKGFMTAEVEFESVAASRSFEPPDWLGEEVTNDGRYQNKHLAVHGVPVGAIALLFLGAGKFVLDRLLWGT